MPTVHTSADDTPPILVVLYGDAIEPDATVAPEGEVCFTVLNRADAPRDFVVATGANLVSRETVGPNDSADVRLRLREGRHVLASAAPGAADMPFAAAADLTVQPADTYDVRSTPPERDEEPG